MSAHPTLFASPVMLTAISSSNLPSFTWMSQIIIKSSQNSTNKFLSKCGGLNKQFVFDCEMSDLTSGKDNIHQHETAIKFCLSLTKFLFREKQQGMQPFCQRARRLLHKQMLTVLLSSMPAVQ